MKSSSMLESNKSYDENRNNSEHPKIFQEVEDEKKRRGKTK